MHITASVFINDDGLAADHEPLDRFVKAMARTSPDSHPDLFPTEDDRLAYWMNAYNALMLARVVSLPIRGLAQPNPTKRPGYFFVAS